MAILSNLQVTALRARFAPRVRKADKPRPRLKPGPKRDLGADMCYHWCPTGRHDWSHVPMHTSSKMDEWLKNCKEHRR